jgi:hypothetical protein
VAKKAHAPGIFVGAKEACPPWMAPWTAVREVPMSMVLLVGSLRARLAGCLSSKPPLMPPIQSGCLGVWVVRKHVVLLTQEGSFRPSCRAFQWGFGLIALGGPDLEIYFAGSTEPLTGGESRAMSIRWRREKLRPNEKRSQAWPGGGKSPSERTQLVESGLDGVRKKRQRNKTRNQIGDQDGGRDGKTSSCSPRRARRSYSLDHDRLAPAEPLFRAGISSQPEGQVRSVAPPGLG